MKLSILLLAIGWGVFSLGAQELLKNHHQLLVITTQSWSDHQGTLVLYEKESDDAPWTFVGEQIPVVLGKNGLALGIGLHPIIDTAFCKKEGDQKSPAGIFSLGSAFGFATDLEMKDLKIHYFLLNEFVEAIDDPFSAYYNCIVDRRTVIPDWNSSEKMNEEPLYVVGITINHNFPNPKINAGSAIFIHVWKDKDCGTLGCTAMSKANLDALLSWLDEKKNPILVQLPLDQYLLLQDQWYLPALSNKHP